MSLCVSVYVAESARILCISHIDKQLSADCPQAVGVRLVKQEEEKTKEKNEVSEWKTNLSVKCGMRHWCALYTSYSINDVANVLVQIQWAIKEHRKFN